MTLFTPCKGKTACRDDGEKCLVCGRSFEAIIQTRQLIDALTDLACAQGYDNVDAVPRCRTFAQAAKEKKVRTPARGQRNY